MTEVADKMGGKTGQREGKARQRQWHNAGSGQDEGDSGMNEENNRRNERGKRSRQVEIKKEEDHGSGGHVGGGEGSRCYVTEGER